MIRKDLEIDRIEIITLRQPSLAGSVIDIADFVTIPLPDHAGVHTLSTPSGMLVVNMSFERINPLIKNPHVVLDGPPFVDTAVIGLEEGVGRKEFKPRTKVVFDASRLTRNLIGWRARSW